MDYLRFLDINEESGNVNTCVARLTEQVHIEIKIPDQNQELPDALNVPNRTLITEYFLAPVKLIYKV